MTGKGNKSGGGSKGDKEDKSSDPAAAHSGSANVGLGLAAAAGGGAAGAAGAAAATASNPPPGPKPTKNYVDMRVGSPVLLYNGNLVATTSMAVGCHTKYTKVVRVPKTEIQKALDGNSKEALLTLIQFIHDKADDYVSDVREDHDLLFLTEKPAPQDFTLAHSKADKVSKFNPKVVVKVIYHFEGGLAIDIPGRSSSRQPILLIFGSK